MKSSVLLLCSCMLLGACDDLKEGVHRIDNAMRGRRDTVVVLPAATRYCYTSFSDVLCYTQPQPGMADQLIGYQEPLVPVDAIYDRHTAPPKHLDTTLKSPPPGNLPPIASSSIGAPPGVKGAEEIKYDASTLEPKSLISSSK